MRPALKTRPRLTISICLLGVLAVGGLSGLAASEPGQTDGRAVVTLNLIPLKLGTAIPLSVQSAGVTWRGNTFHLVRLGSIKFDLGTNDCLKADIQAGVTEFDDVGYDISVAVFDAAGQMLGTARAPCKVQRLWAGNVCMTAQTISLDFGVSSDYARAAGFAVSISNRKVLTPDEWQKPASNDPGRVVEGAKRGLMDGWIGGLMGDGTFNLRFLTPAPGAG